MADEVIYDSAKIYIECASSLTDKITRIEAVISALLDVAIKAAETTNIKEYQLDSGQTKIRTFYNSADEVFRSIEHFEKLKSYYTEKLNGRSFRCVDSKNFRRRL